LRPRLPFPGSNEPTPPTGVFTIVAAQLLGVGTVIGTLCRVVFFAVRRQPSPEVASAALHAVRIPAVAAHATPTERREGAATAAGTASLRRGHRGGGDAGIRRKLTSLGLDAGLPR